MVASASAGAAAPQVPASWVTDVTATSANLRAEIDPQGLDTFYRFQYVTQSAYESGGWSGASQIPAGGEAHYGSQPAGPAFQHLEHLTPATAYRYRPLATNKDGTTPGPEHILTTRPASSAIPACPNDAFKIGAGADLPDCRAYELVSPIDKNGGAIAGPEDLFGGGEIQAAAGYALPGITYSSAGSFGAAAGAPPASQYLARRTEGGWVSENISAPLSSGAYGDKPDGAPYRIFDQALRTGLLFGGLPCRGSLPGCPFPTAVLPASGAPPGHMAYYLRSSEGAFRSILDSAELAHSSVSPQAFSFTLLAASPDLGHLIFSSCAALSAGAIELADGNGGCLSEAQNLYLWGEGGLQAINHLPGQSQTSPGAALAGRVDALSVDGKRAYFSLSSGSEIYLWEQGSSTRLLPETSGGALFQTAATDGNFAIFTKGTTLYRYSATDNASEPIATNVGGVLGASADGSYIYYQDDAALRRWHLGAVSVVAAGSDVAAAGDFLTAASTARVSDDGLHLAFLSDAEIPPFDNLDAETGQPDTELYLFGPPPDGGQPRLLCASCNPSGERPRGSASIPGLLHNGSTAIYRPRVLSSDARRLFFESDDKLTTADTDSRTDVYQWEAGGTGGCRRDPGCPELISGGRETGGTFLDASADGSDVYFLTADSLLPSDPGSIDVYDARVFGGFPEPSPPFVCRGDACQALPSPPEDPPPGTAVPNSGNPAPKYFKPRKKRRHRKHRHRHRHHRSHR